MKAVVWTDVFQIALMFGSMIVVVVRGTIDLGGLEYVFDRAEEGGRLLRRMNYTQGICELNMRHHCYIIIPHSLFVCFLRVSLFLRATSVSVEQIL